VAERVSAEIISLPMFPQLTVGQQSRVVEQLMAFSSKSLQETGRDSKLRERRETYC